MMTTSIIIGVEYSADLRRKTLKTLRGRGGGLHPQSLSKRSPERRSLFGGTRQVRKDLHQDGSERWIERRLSSAGMNAHGTEGHLLHVKSKQTEKK
jgi:hypothetical protein